MRLFVFTLLLFLSARLPSACGQTVASPLFMQLKGRELLVSGAHLRAPIRVFYIEAYCRPGSTNRDWEKTVIRHKTELISESAAMLKIRDTLTDGVVVEHVITLGADALDFQVTATNPTKTDSEVHWAQPCVQVGGFTGFPDSELFPKGSPVDYLPKCFIFLDGKLTRMPTEPWATTGFYTPGQEWCPAHVPREDVNPRPLSTLVPSNGLIGCFSADDRWIFATAWEPYQELFQGIYRCLHSDFRIGGLAAGKKKQVRGKIYIVPNDVPALLRRHAQDFPEK